MISNECFLEDPERRASFSDVITILEEHLTSEEKTRYTEMNKCYQNPRANNYLRIGKSAATEQT